MSTIIEDIEKMQEFIEAIKLTVDLDEEEYTDKEVLAIIYNIIMEYDNG